MKLNRITQFLNHPFPAIYLHLFLPYRTRRVFSSTDYKYLISVSLYSLYWVYKTEPSSLQKLIHYSLEIDKITDPHVRRHWKLVPLLKMELLILKKIKGLIIQDQMRLDALLNRAEYNNLRVFFIPVSIPGNIINSQSQYLRNKFQLRPEQKVVLYFGAVYQERKIDQLIEAFGKVTDPNLVLVLHGGHVKFPYSDTSPNIKTSDQRIEYHQLHSLISSATIGIALYDNSWPNTRLTAFSSEKIARYLQAGVPFIAFSNESYLKLKNEFDCCELILDTAELGSAITTILNNYDHYRSNCFQAYEKYYNITNTVKPLTRFLQE